VLLVAALLCAASLKTVLAADGATPAIPAAFQTPSILSLTLSPATISGGSGDSSTGTVTLNAPAPGGGVVVTLASSNIELAATLPGITVPAGATSAPFTVATNARYRRYSGLAFNASISASLSGSTRSATLHVTAQPEPPDFSSGSQAGANTQWAGSMCGGIAPIGGNQGILYQCSPASGTGFGTCTFQQECTLGCRRVPPNGSTFNDFCASGGPNSVAISRNYIVSGDRVPATIVAEAPAGQGQDQEQGVPGVIDPNFNATHFPHVGIGFPTGAASVRFDVATSYVPAIQFADVVGFWFNASIPPFLITNGRAGHAWLVMLPPDPPPAVAIPTLGDFDITGLNPVIGGESTFGQIDVSGLSRVGGPTITLTSSHPAIVPTTSIVAPATEMFLGFQVPIATQAPAVDTDVVITATDGRYSFSSVLRVLTPPPPPVLSGVSVNPASVTGGGSATGTVTLSAPRGGATVVALSTPAPSSVATMPASVTVPAGATSANFTVNTKPVTSTFSMNIFADLAGSPGRQALLLIRPGGSPSPPAVSALSVNPTTVVGGNFATGTVTLSASAPSGGVSVVLSSSASAAIVDPSVHVPAGATSATFRIDTRSTVTTTTTATISASLGGTTRNASLTVNPPPAPPPRVTLTAFTVSPASVAGGNPSTGTVRLSAPAPSGGVLVSLGSNLPGSASVPTSVKVAAGATSATFTVTTFNVGTTTVQLHALLGDVILFTAITVNSSGRTATLSVTATGRSGHRVTSSPAGIDVTVGSTGSASFNVGRAITLRVSNGREAIWSGACSSGGSKRKTCTFTLTGNAAVAANVR